MAQDRIICLNKSVLDFMEKNLDPESSVAVEIGSGWSTAWLAKRSDKLISFETDPAWVQKVAIHLRDEQIRNCRVILVRKHPSSFTHDLRSRLQRRVADLVLVDCYEPLRHYATIAGWSALKRGGWLIFDDAQRARHSSALSWLNEYADHVRLEWQEGDIETAKERLALAFRKP